MVRLVLVTFFISLLALEGCRTTSSLNLGERSISYGEVQEVMRSHHARIHSIAGEGRISIETPDISQNGSFILTLQKPDSVLIKLQGPFGIKVGTALVTRTDFLFYNSLENKVITGLSSTENLDRILHVRLSFDELLNMFAGGTFLETDLRAPDETRVEDDQYIYTYTSTNTCRKYWIDPTTLFIRKVQFLDQNGTLELEQTFRNFEDVNGVAMPTTIRFVQPISHQRLTFTYSEILVNTNNLHLTFTIPPNAERIHW
jgi:outer membrane lipoprotein-sorting protein